MRRLTFTMRREEGFHPASSELVATGVITRERVHHLNVLEDGTCLLLVDVSGDLDRLRRQSEERSDVLGYGVSGGSEGHGTAYVHTHPPAAIEALIEAARDNGVIVDFPLAGVGDGLEVTLIGEGDAVLRATLGALPEDVETDVRRVGPYLPDGDRVALTDRQREVVRAAIALGYYRSPREASHAEIAEAVGLAPATVTEHLQKAEQRVFEALFGESPAPP